jgi:hypothetical protein
LPRPAWTTTLLFYTFHHCLVDRYVPPCSAFFFFLLRWGLANFFGPSWSGTINLLIQPPS